MIEGGNMIVNGQDTIMSLEDEVTFPISKEMLVEAAQYHHLDPDLIDMIRDIPDAEFEGP